MWWTDRKRLLHKPGIECFLRSDIFFLLASYSYCLPMGGDHGIRLSVMYYRLIAFVFDRGRLQLTKITLAYRKGIDLMLASYVMPHCVIRLGIGKTSGWIHVLQYIAWIQSSSTSTQRALRDVIISSHWPCYKPAVPPERVLCSALQSRSSIMIHNRRHQMRYSPSMGRQYE